MKRVKMMATASGPEGVKDAGKFYTLEDKQADDFVKAKAAKYAPKGGTEEKTKKEKKEKA